MAKRSRKIIRKIVSVLDYIFLVSIFPFCLIGLLCAIPWISKQRAIWNNSVKGSPKALILHQFTLEKVMNRGFELLSPFRNPSIKWLGFLDPKNFQETSIKITDDFYLMTWKSPRIVDFLEKIKFGATSIVLGELIAVFKVTSFCVKNQIVVLRVYKHDYPALQACMVSSFIKIPFIVDIIGNFELISRLFPWADYALDEEFYEIHSDYGTDALLLIKRRLGEIYPYTEEIGETGEVQRYRVKLRLNALGNGLSELYRYIDAPD